MLLAHGLNITIIYGGNKHTSYADVIIDYHQFNVTTSLLEFIVDRTSLILGDVVVDPKTSFLFIRAQGIVKPMGNHLVSAVLEWKDFAGIVVS
jgi:hypothetical protein